MFNSEGFVNPGIGYSRQIEGLEIELAPNIELLKQTLFNIRD
jgi:hypothetical protein